MASSAIVGYSMVALSGNELGFIGSIIGGISTIVAAVMANAAAARRQQRELRYQRKGSGMTGFLLALLLISIAGGWYFANRPKPVVATTVTAAVPITIEEASALAISYLQTASNEATADQAWAMFTEAHALGFKDGIDGFKRFWRSVDTVEATGGPRLITLPTDTLAVVQIPLKYKMVAELIKPGSSACRTESDDFTIVRIDGVLRIDDAKISPGTAGICTN